MIELPFITPLITFISNLFLSLIKKNKRVSIPIIIIGVFLIGYYLFVSGNEITFKLHAQNNEIVSGKSTFINAELSNKNGPLEGRTVKFSLTQNNSGGYLSPDTATSDLNGKATVYYSAGKNPITIDQIKAMYSETSKEINITVLRNMRLDLRAKDYVTAATGSIEIIATVIDQNGKPVEDENVSFEIIKNNSNASLNHYSKATDRNGITTIIYKAGNDGNNKDLIEATIKNSPPKQITIEVSQLVGLVNAHFQYLPDTIEFDNDTESSINTFVCLELINLNTQAINGAVFSYGTVSFLQYKGKARSTEVNRFEIGELAPGQPEYLSFWFDKNKRHWVSESTNNQEELIGKIISQMNIWWNAGNPGKCVFYSIHSDDGKKLDGRYSKRK